MASDRDMAAILEGLAARLKEKSMFLSAVEAGEGAAEIRRLQAELDSGHKQMDKAGIPRDYGSAMLDLAQRINLKLQALADMIEVRDDWVEQARARVAELERAVGDLYARLDSREGRGIPAGAGDAGREGEG